MKRVFATALVALAGVASAAPEESAPASDGSAPAATEQAAMPLAGEEPAAPKRAKNADEQPQDAAEVFVPSEAISEDIAVPFPVDI